MFYWMIFGVRVSYNYGGHNDLYAVVLAFPALIVLAGVEVNFWM